MSAPCPNFGFVVTARLRGAGGDADANALADDLIRVLESNELVTDRGVDRHLEYVVSREGSQATQADRELVLDWAERWRSIAEIEVSDLIDLKEG
jgi:uncharacterized protein YggL (DUF469 family)